MKSRCVLLASIAALGACGEEAPDPDAVDADVEAIREMHENPPIQPVDLERITFADIEKHGLYGAGCGFAKGSGISVVLFAQAERAFMKIDGDIVSLAADKGSTGLPMGAWSEYDGRKYTVSIAKGDDDGQREGVETITWPGAITVRDSRDRAVYTQEGSLQCGA